MQHEAALLSRYFRRADTFRRAAVSNNYLAEMLSLMIYGSNNIECVGIDMETTKFICGRIFASRHRQGDELSAGFLAAIREKVEQYLARRGLPWGDKDVHRCEHEVLSHALAALYLFTHVVLEDKDLDEDIMMQTHAILTHGIPQMQDRFDLITRDNPEYYTTTNGDTLLHVDEDELRQYVREIVNRLHDEIQFTIDIGAMDPVALAARYCYSIFTCPVFISADGRLSRLIMNTLLLKHGSICVTMGDTFLSQEHCQRIIYQAVHRMLWSHVPDQEHKDLSTYLLREVHCSLKSWREALDRGS